MKTIANAGDGGGQADPSTLHVGGIVRFSTSDWPGKLAAVVFLQGCPWRCGYCQNPHLLPARGDSEVDWEATLDWLATRRGMLDAVVFSGGEPTAQPGLLAAIRAVRALGFAVALHTGGAYPRRLLEVARDVDWIGLDIKAPMYAYGEVTGVARSAYAAFASLDLLRRVRVPFEVRTTVHPGVVPPAMLVDLARELAKLGITSWVLQRFRRTGCASATLVAAAGDNAPIDGALVARLREHVPEITVR